MTHTYSHAQTHTRARTRIDKFEREILEIEASFTDFYCDAPEDEAHNPIDVVKALKNLLNGAEDEAALLHVEWQRAKADYPDLTLHHLEAGDNALPPAPCPLPIDFGFFSNVTGGTSLPSTQE